MRILSCDPGKVHFAMCVFDIEKDSLGTSKIDIITTSMLNNPINELSDEFLNERISIFYSEFEDYINKYNPVMICLERYMVRGRIPGNLPEIVNIMIGVIGALCVKHGIILRIANSGVWKNEFNRRSKIKLNDAYKLVKKLPDHNIDSFLIGCHFAVDDKKHTYTEKFIENSLMILREKLKNVVK